MSNFVGYSKISIKEDFVSIEKEGKYVNIDYNINIKKDIEKYFKEKFGIKHKSKNAEKHTEEVKGDMKISDLNGKFNYKYIVKELNEIKNYNKEEILFLLSFLQNFDYPTFDLFKEYFIALGVYPKTIKEDGKNKNNLKHIDFRKYNSSLKKLKELKIIDVFEPKEYKNTYFWEIIKSNKKMNFSKNQIILNNFFITYMIFQTFKEIIFEKKFYNIDNVCLFNKRDRIIFNNLDAKNKLDTKIREEHLITSMEIDKMLQYKKILTKEEELKNNYLELENKFAENKFGDRIVHIIEDTYSNYVNYIFINKLFREFKKEHKINYKKTFEIYLEEIGEQWKLFKSIFYLNSKYIKNNINPIEVLIDENEIKKIPKISFKKRLYNNNKIEFSDINVLRDFNIYDVNQDFAKDFPLIRLLISKIIQLDKKSWFYEKNMLDIILNFMDLCELYLKLKNYDKFRISNY
jgi:hypothetical protein